MDPITHAAASIALALLFLGAARHKWTEGARFHAQFAAYELLPASLAALASRVLMGTELVLALMLLLPSRREHAALVAAGVLVVYAGAISINLARGRTSIDCGCGGRAHGLSAWMVLRNLLLAGAAVMLFLLPAQSRTLGVHDVVVVTVAVAGLALAWALAEQLLGNHLLMRDWRAASLG